MGKEVVSQPRWRRDLDPRTRYNLQVNWMKIKFAIRPTWRVLDIGPMCFPFPFATHYLGVDPRDDPKDGKPFILADIQVRTPFDDNFFDYVYCSHVLEHLDHPVAAAQEISRIGKRGYIEIPNGYSTLYLFYGAVHPKWFPWQEPDGTFVFSPWDPDVLRIFTDKAGLHAMDRIVNGDPIQEKLTAREMVLRGFYYENMCFFYSYQLWIDQIKIRQGKRMT